MIRVRVAVEAPQATAMNCEDVRHGLLALLDGPIGLTDWALLEAHMKHCAECREAEAHLRRVAMASQPVTRPRAMLVLLRKATELARAGVTWSARLMRRRALLHASLATVRELAARIIAGGLQAFDLGTTYAIAEVAHLRASLAISLRSSVAAVANALEAVKRTIRLRPSVQGVGVVLALTFTLSVPSWIDRPEQLAGPAAPPPPEPGPTRVEPAQAELAQLAASLSAPSVEKKIASAPSPRTDERRQSPSAAPPRAAPLPPPDVSASELVTEVASSPPTLLSESPASATHVVGQLSATNPRTVQRDFLALLADVGGTARATFPLRQVRRWSRPHRLLATGGRARPSARGGSHDHPRERVNQRTGIGPPTYGVTAKAKRDTPPEDGR
jgi:predicted anti-sigma-YlaC factor YlaD